MIILRSKKWKLEFWDASTYIKWCSPTWNHVTPREIARRTPWRSHLREGLEGRMPPQGISGGVWGGNAPPGYQKSWKSVRVQVVPHMSRHIRYIFFIHARTTIPWHLYMLWQSRAGSRACWVKPACFPTLIAFTSRRHSLENPTRQACGKNDYRRWTHSKTLHFEWWEWIPAFKT